MKTLLMEYPWLDRQSHHYSVYNYYGKYPNPFLAILGGNLKQNNIEFEVFDSKLEDLSIAESLERVEAIKPDLVGLSAFTSDVYYANAYAGLIKRELPDCKICVGGPHSSVMPDGTLREFSNFDMAVKGEGEHVLTEIIGNLERHGDVSRVPNLAWRNNAGDVTLNPYSKEMECRDLDSIGIPVWDRLPPGFMYYVQTIRGCPFSCQFCYRICGKRVRYKSPETVIAEIDLILGHADPNHIFISDSTFGLNRKRVMPILEAFIDKGYAEKIQWKTTARFSVTTEEMLTKMKRAGCTFIFFGVESGNSEIAKTAKQNIDLDNANKLLAVCNKLGIETQGGFIFGHPNEDKKALWDTVRLATRMCFDMIVIGIMVPWPGTKVYEMAVKGEGGYRLVSADWRDFDKHYGASLQFENFSPKYLTRMRLLTYLLFFLRQGRIKDLFKTVFEHLGVLKQFILASIRGPQKHVESKRKTELELYLEARGGE